jgi:LacI family transcriptional regulator
VVTPSPADDPERPSSAAPSSATTAPAASADAIPPAASAGTRPARSAATTPPVPSAAPPGRATLADVARLAGVSAKTVSRVVTDTDTVSPATRARVEAAVAELRFRPNFLARDLRHGAVSKTVGFVMGDITNPFYFELGAGMERELNRGGLTMVLTATEDDASAEERVVGSLLAQRVRALVVVPIAADQSYLEHERSLGTPIVCVDRPPVGLEVDTVLLANRAGAAAAVDSLTALGHRRIAYVGSPGDLYTNRERLAGYREALARAGVHDTAHWERTDGDGRDFEAAIHDVLHQADAPTAVLTANNRASAALLRAIGTDRVDLAYIGFDDFDLADVLGFSVVAYDMREFGRLAAQCVLDRLDAPDAPPRALEVPVHLVHRGSGERPPA